MAPEASRPSAARCAYVSALITQPSPRRPVRRGAGDPLGPFAAPGRIAATARRSAVLQREPVSSPRRRPDLREGVSSGALSSSEGASMHEPDTPAVDPYRASLRRSRERRAAANRRRRWRFRQRGVITGLALTMALGGGAALAAGGGVSSHRSSSGLLRSGSNGSTVAALQRALGITADGVYGPATRRAVRAFQAAHGLIVDGIAGPQTLGALGL